MWTIMKILTSFCTVSSDLKRMYTLWLSSSVAGKNDHDGTFLDTLSYDWLVLKSKCSRIKDKL